MRLTRCTTTILSLALCGAILSAHRSVAQAASPAAGSAAPAGSEWTPVVLDDAALAADWLHSDALRQEAARLARLPGAGRVTPEQDARGGCDGVKNGEWGFHTENEDNPWWQVDLGRSVALDRVALFNRCDSCGSRNHGILVLLSEDAVAFRQVYQHDGTPFLGFTDQKPLVVALAGATARYVRVQVPGRSYLHLDEIEVYASGAPANLALHQPAAQSSVSTWSVVHPLPGEAAPTGDPAPVVERGLKLAAALERLEVPVAAETARLRQIVASAQALPADGAAPARQELYLQARRTVRALALRNPLLADDTILFVKGAPTRFPHMSDQYYGWWSRPGGGVCLLRGVRTGRPETRCLTPTWAPGSFMRPDLSDNARKVVFSYARYYPDLADLKNKASKTEVPEDAFYHLFEMNLDGSGVRQLTHGRYDDMDAKYLPDGRIAFVSTRKGVALQCGTASAAATAQADLPDSYVRCGGDNYRPVPVFTLHSMAADGSDLQAISAFENFEWTPAVANDGRLLYTRWDYIDRFNGHFFSLWSANPNGTNPQLVYGNYTVRPQVVLEARAIPGSTRLVATAAAHHSFTGGSLILLDRTRGTEDDAPLQRLTPEVPFPETEAWANSYYANPFPLSEEFFLVAWSDQRLPPHGRIEAVKQNPVNATGLYLYDAFGNLELLYRDPEISSACPIPVRTRVAPPTYADGVNPAGPQEGAFLVQDIYRGLEPTARGTVRALRLVGVTPKTQPQMNTPNLGVSAEDPGKFLIGTVPVAADGSAYFRVPSGVPVFFQALDERGVALQTMRTLTYVMPGQTLACVGCHEPREATPRPGRGLPLASRGAPARPKPGPEGTWPLRFDRLVQPVLDQHCVSCHRPDSGNPKAALLDLTAATSYQSLLDLGDKNLAALARERDRSIVGEGPAQRSRLLQVLTADPAHLKLELAPADLERLVTWMDLYAQRQGHFSAAQEAQLVDFRRQLAPLLDE
jgi:hypothetical protein